MNEKQRTAFKRLSELVQEDLRRVLWYDTNSISNASLRPLYDDLKGILNMDYNAFVVRVNLSSEKCRFPNRKVFVNKNTLPDPKEFLDKCIEKYKEVPEYGFKRGHIKWKFIARDYNDMYAAKYTPADMKKRYTNAKEKVNNGFKSVISLQKRMEIYEAANTGGKTQQEIADEYGVHKETVHKIKKYGIDYAQKIHAIKRKKEICLRRFEK